MSIPYGIAYWHDQKSRNGIPGDILNSMLQKSIRRGKEDSAIAAACEMYVTSPEYLEMLWKRLACIAVEDIGFGDPYASRLIRTLNEIRHEFPYADGDQACSSCMRSAICAAARKNVPAITCGACSSGLSRAAMSPRSPIMPMTSIRKRAGKWAGI